MQFLTFTSPAAAVALLAPAVCFLMLGLIGDAPGEWGRAALIAWTALVSALLAGASIDAGAGALGWLSLVLGLAAIMVGGPPGLIVAGIAAALLLAAGAGLPAPRWLPLGLALPPFALGLRQLVG